MWIRKTIVELKDNTLYAMFNLGIVGSPNENTPFVRVAIGQFVFEWL